MSRFHELQRAVTEYFEACLTHGVPLMEVLDQFRHEVVPSDIKSQVADATPAEIRRHGQLVGTQYLLKQMEEQSATLPAYDHIYKVAQ